MAVPRRIIDSPGPTFEELPASAPTRLIAKLEDKVDKNIQKKRLETLALEDAKPVVLPLDAKPQAEAVLPVEPRSIAQEMRERINKARGVQVGARKAVGFLLFQAPCMR